MDALLDERYCSGRLVSKHSLYFVFYLRITGGLLRRQNAYQFSEMFFLHTRFGDVRRKGLFREPPCSGVGQRITGSHIIKDRSRVFAPGLLQLLLK